MAKVDAEVLLYKLKTFIQDNLSSIITSINTEKNDGITLISPHNNAYLELSMDDKVLGYDPFIFIYLEPIPVIVNGPRIQQDIRFEVCLFKAKSSGNVNDSIMGLRYYRAIQEVAALAWDKVLKGFRYEIETLSPVDVQLINSEKWHKVYGIALTVSLS